MCIEKDCKIQPVFNFEGNVKALYCYAHKLKGMVDVKSKTCIHEGCKKQHHLILKMRRKRYIAHHIN